MAIKLKSFPIAVVGQYNLRCYIVSIKDQVFHVPVGYQKFEDYIETLRYYINHPKTAKQIVERNVATLARYESVCN